MSEPLADPTAGHPAAGGGHGIRRFRIFGLPSGPTAPSVPPPHQPPPPFAMSKHPSLKASGTVGGKRSVLKRFERVKLMKQRGEWKDGRSPLGLPKTKHQD